MTSDTCGIDGRIAPSVRKLWERFYPNYTPDSFAELLLGRVRREHRVLEIGAGSGAGNQKHFALRGRVERYFGIDPDTAVLGNHFLDEAQVARSESLPFPDESFDLVFHCNVAEHFESPAVCNREIARVLKPGGTLLFQTPSRFYYPMIVARLTPHAFHKAFLKRLGAGRNENEVHPTYYRLNDEKSIREQLQDLGLECVIRHQSTPPGYLRFSRLTFLAGVLFERTMERAFPALRALLIVSAWKKPAQ